MRIQILQTAKAGTRGAYLDPRDIHDGQRVVQLLGLDLEQLCLGKSMAMGFQPDLGLQERSGGHIHLLARPAGFTCSAAADATSVDKGE